MEKEKGQRFWSEQILMPVGERRGCQSILGI